MSNKEEIFKKIENKEELSQKEFTYILLVGRIVEDKFRESASWFDAMCATCDTDDIIVRLEDRYFKVSYKLTPKQEGFDYNLYSTFIGIKEVVKKETLKTITETTWIDLEEYKKEVCE